MDGKNRQGFKPFGTQRQYHWVRNLRYEDRRIARSIADTSNAAVVASLFSADNGSCSASYSLIMEPPCFNHLNSQYVSMITVRELFAILLTGIEGINVYTFQARSDVMKSALIAASLRYVEFGPERKHLKHHLT